VSNIRFFNTSYKFSTKGEIEFVDLTDKLQGAVVESGVRSGLVHVFAPHATGVLILTENERDLLEDIKEFFEKIAPKNRGYKHISNAHSHLRSIVFPPDKTIPVIDSRAELGTWQSLMFVETDVHPRRRTVFIQVIGEQ
jgi:secondary thiamine-phosphate synthase enzyme